MEMDKEEQKTTAFGFTVERVSALSDGVFAVAITLLVLSIAVPDIHGNVTSAKLAHGIGNLWPHFFAYVLSFIIIGMFWMSHHALFSAIQEVDRGLLWFNMIYLLLIVFVPYPTGLLALFGDVSTAVIFYAAIMAAAGLMQAGLGFYATHNHRLVDDAFDLREANQLIRHSTEMAAVFLLSIVIAPFNSSAAQYFWITLFVIQFLDGYIVKRKDRKAVARAEEAA